MDFRGRWHSAAGRCRQCNLKGFLAHSGKDTPQLQAMPCDCLIKTLRKRGFEDKVRTNQMDYEIVKLNQVLTMIAREKIPPAPDPGKPGADSVMVVKDENPPENKVRP